MRLSQETAGLVLQAIEDSFSPKLMANILFRRLGARIFNIVGEGEPWPNQVNAVYQEYDSQFTIERLLVALRDARPAVPEFAFALDELGFAHIQGPQTTGRSALEALLTHGRAPFQDVVQFRGQLSVLEAQVCRVVCSHLGTGALVAPDLVLTNRHVIAQSLAADGHQLTQTVRCIFDDKVGGGGYKAPLRSIEVVSVEASSPHASEDERPGPMPDSLERLDYALLRLSARVGDQAIIEGGAPRGAMVLTAPEEAPAVNSGLVILQHPGGEPMKIDIGAVVARGRTRIRHSVNTKRGSSGAPVFDPTLRLIALHHSGHESGPAKNPGYNQAIPMDLILADARAKGVTI